MPAQTSSPGFLPPDIAFDLEIGLEEADTIVARWEIADTYYLYRDKFRFAMRTPPGAALGDALMPAGTLKDDPYFGLVEVFYQEARAAIPVLRGATGAVELSLDVTYQGCTDLGLCYPPVTKMTLPLPPPLERSDAKGKEKAP